MRFVLLTVFVLASHLAIASDEYQTIQLEEGIVLKVKQLRNNRFLPHAFYDQATASIPLLYPDHVYLVKRRYGRLGEMKYSIVCYKETKQSSEVLISGTAVLNNAAWSFDTRVPQSSFGDKLLIVLEAVEKLPSNKSIQAAPRNGAPDL